MEHTSAVEDVYIPLKPLLTISRIFGITPFSFTRQHKVDGITISYEFLDIIFVCMWIFGHFVSGCYSVYGLMQSSELSEKILILLTINVISIHSTVIITLITSTSVNRRKLPSMLYKLINIDQMIGYKKVTNTYRRTRLQTVTKIVLLVLAQILIYSLNYYTRGDGTFINVMHMSFENVAITFNTLTIITFADLALTLKCRYKYIVEDLEEYFEVKRAILTTNFKAQNRNSSSNTLFYKQSPLALISPSELLSEFNESYKIRKLRFVYIQLYDCVALLNSYFGIPILFEILLVMVTSVSALYGGYHYLRVGDSDFKMRILGYYLISFGILFLAKFVWLIICCHDVTEEANRCVISIQRINTCCNVRRETALELDKLSAQMTNMRVQFSACGFISLGLPILCTTFGGILTYILIMVQMA
jgi:hypothetical protein